MAGMGNDNGSTVRDHAEGLIGAQRTAAADELADLSDAFRGASEHLRAHSRSMIAGLAQTTADRIENIAATIRERDLVDLLDDAQHFARRQPEVFFLGAVALGFLFTRTLRSTRPTMRRQPEVEPEPVRVTPMPTAGV